MLNDLMSTFWAQWPVRVLLHTGDPAVAYTYRDGKGRAAVSCALTQGELGVTATPGLARTFHLLCDEVGIYGPLREALAQRAFSDRLHLVGF